MPLRVLPLPAGRLYDLPLNCAVSPVCLLRPFRYISYVCLIGLLFRLLCVMSSSLDINVKHRSIHLLRTSPSPHLHGRCVSLRAHSRTQCPTGDIPDQYYHSGASLRLYCLWLRALYTLGWIVIPSVRLSTHRAMTTDSRRSSRRYPMVGHYL